jgi:hypothetical protein
MLKNRAPYDAEVDAEVAKEYQRIQDQKRRVRPDHGSEIEAIRTRVTDLEGTVTRVGENVAASHKRIEEMMLLILHIQGQKNPTSIGDTTEPSVSAKMAHNAALTATTEELTQLAPKQAPTPALSAKAGTDMRLPSVVHVPTDSVEDAECDANADVVGVQIIPETIIASIIDDILQPSKKPTEPPAIEEHVELTNEEMPVQAMVDVEEGHPEISGNADVPEEIQSLEQVTMSKTHEYHAHKKPFHCRKKELTFLFSVGMMVVVLVAVSTCAPGWTSSLTEWYHCIAQLMPFETMCY